LTLTKDSVIRCQYEWQYNHIDNVEQLNQILVPSRAERHAERPNACNGGLCRVNGKTLYHNRMFTKTNFFESNWVVKSSLLFSLIRKTELISTTWSVQCFYSEKRNAEKFIVEDERDFYYSVMKCKVSYSWSFSFLIYLGA
jgi:hypothetical protein